MCVVCLAARSDRCIFVTFVSNAFVTFVTNTFVTNTFVTFLELASGSTASPTPGKRWGQAPRQGRQTVAAPATTPRTRTSSPPGQDPPEPGATTASGAPATSRPGQEDDPDDNVNQSDARDRREGRHENADGQQTSLPRSGAERLQRKKAGEEVGRTAGNPCARTATRPPCYRRTQAGARDPKTFLCSHAVCPAVKTRNLTRRSACPPIRRASTPRDRARPRQQPPTTSRTQQRRRLRQRSPAAEPAADGHGPAAAGTAAAPAAAAAAVAAAAPAPAAAEDMDMESSTEQLRPVGQNTGGDTDGIASVIDACLAQPTEEAIGAAHLALYRYKRAHPGDTDAAMLEDALESAKRVCRRTDGTPAQPFRDIRPVAGEL